MIDSLPLVKGAGEVPFGVDSGRRDAGRADVEFSAFCKVDI